MRYRRTAVSLRTFGLAFAIVLSPAFLQTDMTDCTMEHGIGDTSLAALEVKVGGEDMIAFDPAESNYEVLLAADVEAVVIVAQSNDPAADVSYNLATACPPPVAMGHFPNDPVGGGEVPLEQVPDGHSLLKVYVHAPEGKAGFYAIHFTRPMLCE